MTQTTAAFKECLKAFKKLHIPEPAAVDNQRNYLQRTRKNDKLSVPQFLDRMKHINMLILQFPDAKESDSFSNNEKKKLFYHAMLSRWRTNFLNSGQNVLETSLDTLHTYMVSSLWMNQTLIYLRSDCLIQVAQAPLSTSEPSLKISAYPKKWFN